MNEQEETTTTTATDLKSREEFFRIVKAVVDFNVYSTLVCICVGIVGNILAILLIIGAKRHQQQQQNKQCSVRRNNDYYNSDSSKKLIRIRQVSTKAQQQQQQPLQHTTSVSSSSSASSTVYFSTDVYILTLACSDLVFLTSHLVDRMFPELLVLFPSALHGLLNLVNTSNILCKSVSHVRNASRLVSAYTIVFFAFERFLSITRPFSTARLKHAKSTLLLVLGITSAAFAVTSYTPLFIGLVDKRNESGTVVSRKCELVRQYEQLYFYTSFVYFGVNILVPIVLICTFNVSIVRVLFRRKKEFMIRTCSYPTATSAMAKVASDSTDFDEVESATAAAAAAQPKANQTASEREYNKIKLSSNLATRMLIFISASFVCLNAPYCVGYLLQVTRRIFQEAMESNLEVMNVIKWSIVVFKITEILHILNFCLNFFLYCFSSKVLRKELKYRVLFWRRNQ